MRAVHSKFGGPYPREFTGKPSAAELCVACIRCPSLAKVHCVPDAASGEIEEIVRRFTALRVLRSSGLPDSMLGTIYEGADHAGVGQLTYLLREWRQRKPARQLDCGDNAAKPAGRGPLASPLAMHDGEH
jgi:hypothetical protein